jgi:hypothetical protein
MAGKASAQSRASTTSAAAAAASKRESIVGPYHLGPTLYDLPLSLIHRLH